MLDKEPLPSDEWRHHEGRTRKKTQRWCKGKEGREHTPEVVLDKNYGFLDSRGAPRCHLPEGNLPLWTCCTHQVACSTCGKVLEWHPEVCPTTGLNLTTGEVTRP